jgi:hypothetical protein
MKTMILMGAMLVASLSQARAPQPDTREQDSAVIQNLIDRHFEIWNDSNSSRRVPNYAGAVSGHAGVEQKLSEVQGKFPGYRFSPDPASWNHGLGRVTWGYGPADNPNLIRGEDIFTVADGKIATLRVFINKK